MVLTTSVRTNQMLCLLGELNGRRSHMTQIISATSLRNQVYGMVFQ